jgi:putative ABC transport system permease protein
MWRGLRAVQTKLATRATLRRPAWLPGLALALAFIAPATVAAAAGGATAEAGVVPISGWQLAFTVILVGATGAISAALQLGLHKQLLWGAVRTFAQLTLMGYVLTYLFELNNPWVVLLYVLFMTAVATRTATQRSSHKERYPSDMAFVSLLASTFLVGAIVVGLILSPHPWYSARVVIPITGMILGNSMNGIGLALERLYDEVRLRQGEVEELLSFGATPWEAIRQCARTALATAMKPTINSLMVVGLVSLPGMMTGQILAGADPRQAVRYQIVVMLMIAAAVAIGCLALVGLSYKRLFTSESALRPHVRQSRAR